MIICEVYDPAIGRHFPRQPAVQVRRVHPKSGQFTRNESYWGKKALPASTQFTFYDTQNPSILALTGGTMRGSGSSPWPARRNR